MLRTLFKSDFFKKARYQHLKSPAEVVVGTLRLVGGYELPKPGYGELSMQPSYMGQDLLNPPSVEGWHTGKEWINSGSLMSRINFVAAQIGNPDLPGVQKIIDRLKAQGTKTPEQLVTNCLDLLGPVEVGAGDQEGAHRRREAVGRDQLGWRRRAERHTACRRDAAAHRGDARIPVRLKHDTERIGGTTLCRQRSNRRIPCWSCCSSPAATTT